MIYHFTPTRLAKVRSLIILCAKMWSKEQSSLPPEGEYISSTTLVNNLAPSDNAENTFIMLNTFKKQNKMTLFRDNIYLIKLF